MKIIFSLALLLLGGSIAYSQSISSIDVGKRTEYMMKMYKIHRLKAEKYEKQILPALECENEQLKNQQINSSKFKEEQKKIYKKYGDMVSQVFSKGRYKTWSSCTQELERYHVLSETKFIPLEKMRALYKAESVWEKERDKMLTETIDEQRKIENVKSMLSNLNEQIRKILGMESGNWYIAYKEMTFRALDNMDKYGATYNEGYRIAEIEADYSKQRQEVWRERLKNRNEKLQEIEDNKLNAIKKDLPVQVAEKWKAVNNSYLEYILTKRYGLNKTQIGQFKDAYNAYAIEEYKIINEQKRLSASEKTERLKKNNEEFCEKVRPYFKGNSYKKWKGKRMYDFKQRIEQKNKK